MPSLPWRKATRADHPLFAFCEPVTATPTSRIHIRSLDDWPKLGGGVKGPTLCGRTFTNGWDLGGEVAPEIVAATVGRETGPTCPDCAAIYLGETD